ncbi:MULTISPECIES: GNAT family N-acetyltransferase [Paraburkholderia]|uniref:GNAT family N-acetyltransferase n=1 Tax=Paraburkholderia TaxID=1822464 RepID=UPI002AB21093|nr:MULTISPECIES: GNAT family N-acetyltransferase [Paraburkholderia]
MPRKIQLRTASEDDISRIEMWAQAIDADQYMSRHLPYLPDLLLWKIIIVDGTEAGTAWAERKDGIPGIVFLGIFLGQSELFGEGVGSTVIRDVIAAVRAFAGEVLIRLNVRSSNTRAIACYKKCGFIQIASGEKVSAAGNLIDTMTMQYTPTAESEAT